jgi:hypothetical protein
MLTSKNKSNDEEKYFVNGGPGIVFWKESQNFKKYNEFDIEYTLKLLGTLINCYGKRIFVKATDLEQRTVCKIVLLKFFWGFHKLSAINKCKTKIQLNDSITIKMMVAWSVRFFKSSVCTLFVYVILWNTFKKLWTKIFRTC